MTVRPPDPPRTPFAGVNFVMFPNGTVADPQRVVNLISYLLRQGRNREAQQIIDNFQQARPAQQPNQLAGRRPSPQVSGPAQRDQLTHTPPQGESLAVGRGGEAFRRPQSAEEQAAARQLTPEQAQQLGLTPDVLRAQQRQQRPSQERPHAETVRSDAGQVPPTGTPASESQGESRPDLQQPAQTPPAVSDRIPSPQDIQPATEEVDRAAQQAATSPTNGLPEPTERQKEAGLRSLERKTKVNQSVDDSVLTDAKLFGDRSSTESLRSKGFQSVERDIQHMVLSHMRTAFNDKQVLRAVIKSVPVDVMNRLVGRQWTAEDLLHDPSMLTHRLAVSRDVSIFEPVASFVDSLASIVEGRPAGGTTKEPFLSGPSRSTKPGTTIKASSQGALNASTAAKTPIGVPDSAGISTESSTTSRAGEIKSGHVGISIAGQEDSVDINPTEPQKEAGVYKKGHVRLHGMEISIENPQGSTRSGVDKGGQRWEQTMAHRQ